MATIYDHVPAEEKQAGLEKLSEKTTMLQRNEASYTAEIAVYAERSCKAMNLVDDIVLKNYLNKIADMDVVPMGSIENEDEIVLFKINKMVYEKDEYATDKFISVVSAMTYANCTVFLIVQGGMAETDFYLGIRCNDEKRTAASVALTLENAIRGQFPGIQLEDISVKKKDQFGKETCKKDEVFNRLQQAKSISSCVGIPTMKNSKGEYTNANFVQGIEKLALAMQGKEYTAVIIAQNTVPEEINNIRSGYENIYTELSAMSSQQLAYSTNESLSNALSRTKGHSDTTGTTDTVGSGTTHTTSSTRTSGTSCSVSETKGSSEENTYGKASRLVSTLSGPLLSLGSILCATGVGAPAGAVLMGAGALAGTASVAIGMKAKTLNESKTKQIGSNDSEARGTSKTQSTQQSKSVSQNHTETFSTTEGSTSQIGSSKNFTITVQNKQIQNIMKRIDKQLERIDMCESTGLWAGGAYFLSNDNSTAEIGATIFRSIMQGEQSGVESSAINTWRKGTSKASEEKFGYLTNYVAGVAHPVFLYRNALDGTEMPVTPVSLLSSKELSMMIGLPRKSVPGFPVIEHTSLGKEVVTLGVGNGGKHFELGCIFDQGIPKEHNRVRLDVKSLTQHTFVTGSTGCGKSETVYSLIDHLRKEGAKFLIIEPAKGEYKQVFGNERVYGTNPLRSELLKVNPFRFPEGIHVLEHVDRLIEIFNVCWPMYAAMPAVLKEATLNAYEDCGWDLLKSKNSCSQELFPTFADLQNELIWVISNSAYSEEVKSNYTGSLVTRVKSLANGINGEIFSGNEIGDQILFDENVIVDLSRIGSQETKSLIMGILIMRLNEYRSTSGIEANSSLRHVTVLEEAHNILKRCSQEQSMEGSNVAGKSVEMISNAIAEMRTYGEGFIIVDQSPNAVDISAIRNTNTKIIMRLPEDSDRRIAGKAAALKDNQVDEIAKLPTGVAVVYQNDWEEPVLCRISMYTGSRFKYEFRGEYELAACDQKTKLETLKFLLKGRLNQNIEFDLQEIKKNLCRTNLSTFNKLAVYTALKEYDEEGETGLWKDGRFEELSRIVTELFSAKTDVVNLAKRVKKFDDLSKGLKKLIHSRIPESPEVLDLAISQCFMRDYSVGDELCKKVYSAWLQQIKESIM